METAPIKLIIGDKAWSSWSLRPWLAATRAGLAFEEVLIRLRQPDTAAQIASYSPSGRVPALHHGELVLWDSLAICEYIADLVPDAQLWPRDRTARAVCRAVCAEMHSGFYALRTEFPMDLHARIEGRVPSPTAQRDIARIVQIWTTTRATYGGDGPFLFGGFTIADAMYAPVATRFRTYNVDLAGFGDNGTASEFAATLLAMPEMIAWSRAA